MTEKFSTMSDNRPPLLRPIPRRPFTFDIKSPTPPQDEVDETQEQEQDRLLANFRRELMNTGFLDPQFASSPFPAAQYSHSPPLSTASISRPQSTMNLNSSTLAGIYQTSGTGQERVFHDDDRSELHTPWGTGAETPVKRRESISEATYELMRDRSHLPHRRLSTYSAESTPLKMQTSTLSTAFSLVFRVVLLCLLGEGYGILVTRFHEEQGLGQLTDGSRVIRPAYRGGYLAFWGIAGITVGALQPWFDKVWEKKFGLETGEETEDVLLASQEAGTGTDWVLVMRAVGVFVGIVFAIRKLDWTSTMQLSATLSLVNPLLWWLIDRSIPGFILSAGVALVGSIFLLGIDPQLMPLPSIAFVRHNISPGAEPALPVVLGGLASQKTVETGIWTLSVLFCSSLFFGNVGRRLAWESTSVRKDRWGGLR